ncbi:MAG TPA: serine O-acetyltransferase EpsC [Polyangia bacterium]|nr:serine O-acetyltransferase EpsC [Polyangia bacterium]
MSHAANVIPDAQDPAFTAVVEGLCEANEELLRGRRKQRGRHALPSRAAVASVVDDLRAVLFPGHFGATDLAPANIRYYVGARLDELQVALGEQVRRGLAIACDHRGLTSAGECPFCDSRMTEIVRAFIERLPDIRRTLETDLKAAYASDPAARFLDETLYCYPGILAITQHRLAHALHKLAVPLIPRMMAELAHAATGIDIHPGAEIGPYFFIDHGTGVVIGETCQIGARVRLYQGVTLGARGFARDADGTLTKGLPRHPMIGDDVVIYAGATVLGRVTIGDGAVIGGNVWLTRDVAPNARVTQARLQHDSFQDGAGI